MTSGSTERTVLLDTCVLYPVHLNDTLLRLARTRLFRPRWSADILAELRRCLARGGLAPEYIDRRIAYMTHAFPDAAVSGHHVLIDAMTNDPKERHVLAAAVRGHASALVTFNLRDFAVDSVEPHGVVATAPDDFLLGLLHAHPTTVVEVLTRQAAGYRRPPSTTSDLLRTLERSGLPRFSTEVPRHLDDAGQTSETSAR